MYICICFKKLSRSKGVRTPTPLKIVLAGYGPHSKWNGSDLFCIFDVGVLNGFAGVCNSGLEGFGKNTNFHQNIDPKKMQLEEEEIGCKSSIKKTWDIDILLLHILWFGRCVCILYYLDLDKEWIYFAKKASFMS